MPECRRSCSDSEELSPATKNRFDRDGTGAPHRQPIDKQERTNKNLPHFDTLRGEETTGVTSIPNRLRIAIFRSIPSFPMIFGLLALVSQCSVSRRGTLERVALGLAGLLGAGTVAGDETDNNDHDDIDGEDGDRYVVGLESGTATASVAREAMQIHRSFSFSSIGGVVVGRFNEDTRLELEGRSDVRYVQKDSVRRPQLRSVSGTAVDEDLDEEQMVPWGVERVGATEIHEQGNNDDGATVAILDSGIDPEHESLEVAEGEAFADCSGADCATDWADDTGHGTHCAGSVSALDNGVGVVGVAPDVELCSVKVLAGDGSGYDSDIAAGIEWCVENDVDVINLSLGGSEEAQVLEDALSYAYERGVLTIGAAGNTGGQVDYPAAYDECIAVGATDDRDEVPSWSSHGDGIELVAPGEDVLSTKPGDEYEYLSGTSMSTPHVAAVAAQLMSRGLPHAENLDDFDNPGGTRGLLRDTAEDLGFDDDEQGYGLLSAFEAFEELEPVTTDDVTNVRATTATCNGTLNPFEEANDAEVYFEWRDASGSEWTETAPEALSSSDEFNAELDDLTANTEYDVRAVVEMDGERTAGNVETFTTGLDSLAIETDDIEVYDHRSVSAVGELRGLNNAESVDVLFRLRDATAEDWEETDPQTVDAIGSFEDDIGSLEPETEYEIEAVADADGETETGETVSFETDPEPGLPEIDRFELTDDSNDMFVRCNVHWAVSDRDENLELVATELRYADDDEEIHRIATEIEDGEGEASGVHTVRNSDRIEGAGEEYEIALTATDSEGNVTEETEQVALDERSPPPSIDRFEITRADFLGSPEAVVEWTVSDAGEELDAVELEMRIADESEIVDSASSMARGEEESGEDSLRNKNGDGSENKYDVTIRATDYFEQTTEETKRVTLEGSD